MRAGPVPSSNRSDGAERSPVIGGAVVEPGGLWGVSAPDGLNMVVSPAGALASQGGKGLRVVTHRETEHLLRRELAFQDDANRAVF